jgi:hypothetical protein
VRLRKCAGRAYELRQGASIALADVRGKPLELRRSAARGMAVRDMFNAAEEWWADVGVNV